MKSDIEIKYLELLRKPVKTKAEMQELDEIGMKFQNQLRNETKSLLDDLVKVGVDVSSVWDLVNTKEPYPDAIDVLIKHLSRNYHPRNKEGIVRALIVHEAKGKANESLFEEYDKTPKEMESLRWAIGYALANLMMKKDMDRIIGIVKDAGNGKSRGELIKALGAVKSMQAEDVLISLLEDKEVTHEAIWALRKMKSTRAREKVQVLVDHSNETIRKEARKFLK